MAVGVQAPVPPFWLNAEATPPPTVGFRSPFFVLGTGTSGGAAATTGFSSPLFVVGTGMVGAGGASVGFNGPLPIGGGLGSNGGSTPGLYDFHHYYA